MPLHRSQQTNLDYLLDPDIIDYCQFDRFDLKLTLTATDADRRWPGIRIWVDGQVIADQQIADGIFEFEYAQKVDMNCNNKVLEIEYYGKTDQDTITDTTGNIVQNQSVTIERLLINDIDIIENDTMYQLGNYTAELSPEKRAYYIEHGYSVEPTHSLTMYENGRWRLTIPLPVLTAIVKLKAKQETHEKWPDPDLLNAIVDTVNNIRSLEQKLKEQQ